MAGKRIANRQVGRIAAAQARRLASLTALGTAALAAGGHAEAAIIYSGPLDVQVGFDAGATTLALALPPGSGAGSSLARIRLYTQRRTVTTAPGSATHVRIGTRSIVAKGAAFKAGGTLIALAATGQTFNQIGSKTASAGAHLRIGAQHSTHVSVSNVPVATTSGRLPNVTKSTGFALFAFSAGGGKTDYGWLDLSLTFGTNGPDVTVLGYAYDDSGNHAKAGDTGAVVGVPEPSSAALELSGLGALVLGAAGLRRWRAARSAA